MEKRKMYNVFVILAMSYIILTICLGFVGKGYGAALPETAILLVDYGATEAENTFSISGWDTVIKDVYTGYRDYGPGGTVIVCGSEAGYNYQGVTGPPRAFSTGDQVAVTWYNHSDTSITFTPKISFDDPDRPVMGETGTWHNMSSVTAGPGETAQSFFEFSTDSQGSYETVNVNVNYSNYKLLVCDKIELILPSADTDTEPPDVPQNLSAETLFDLHICLSWDYVSDNIATAGYKVYNGEGIEIGTTVDTEFMISDAGPGTYTYTVSAYDLSGNESAHSDPLTLTIAPGTTFLFVDFGGTEADNQFGISGWDTVIKDIYTGYRDYGPGGTVITVGAGEGYDYQGITGPSRAFSSGDRIAITWYNHSDTAITFTPKISFDDPDRPVMGETGTWHNMSSLSPGPGETARSFFEFNADSQGNYGQVSVNVNYSNHKLLVCDKIELIIPGTEPDTEPPSVPQNLGAETLLDLSICLTWDPASDNIAAAGYRIYNEDGIEIGSTAGTEYMISDAVSGTYTYTVTAYDASGNESEHSDPLTVAIDPGDVLLIADFGGTEDENRFGISAWDTIIKDPDTDYRDYGPGGTAITISADPGYDYQGVTGSARTFFAGDRIIVTWYNHSDTSITFTPKISFDDPDRPVMGETGTWYNMSEVTLGGKGFGQTVFEFNTNSQASYGLVNVSMNYSNQEMLICDRISLVEAEEDTQAPTVPENVSAILLSESIVRICWDPALDNRGVTGYEVFRNGLSLGTVSEETCFNDTDLSPLTEYEYTIESCDAAGNCSERSAAISIKTPEQILEFESRVTDCNNDGYEDDAYGGVVNLTDSVLRMGRIAILVGYYPSGIRFTNVEIPQGAVITAAYIEVEAGLPSDSSARSRSPRGVLVGPNGYPTSFIISVQSSDHAPAFSSDPYNISERTGSGTTVEWNISSPWTAHEKYQTPDMSSLVQEIVNQEGWCSGNAMAFIITGTANEERYAKSCDAGDPDASPLLHIEYFVEEPPVPQEIDLIPENIDLSDTELDAQTLKFTGTLKVTITNQGTAAPSSAYEVAVFEDSDADGAYDASTDHVIATAQVSEGPEPGESLELLFTEIETHLLADHRVFVYVDTGNLVQETDEANNITHSIVNDDGTGDTDEIALSIPSDGNTTISGPEGTAEPGTVVTATNLTTGSSVSATAAADGSFSLILGAELTDKIEVTFTDPSGESATVSFPFGDPEEGTAVIGSEGGTVRGPGGIRAVVPPGAVPDATFINIGRIAEAPTGDEVLPDGFCHIGGIDLEISDASGNDIVAEEELKLSFPLSDNWDSSDCGCDIGNFPADQAVCCELSPDCDYPLVVLRRIEIFGTPEYALNNIAHIKDGRIDTASPPFPGARASGPHMFVKPMYPQGFVVTTPSPLFGGIGGIGVGSDFGTTFCDPLCNMTAPIVIVSENSPFDVKVYTPSGDVIAEKNFDPLMFESGFAHIPIPSSDDEGEMLVSETWPEKDAEDVAANTEITVLFTKQVYGKSVSGDTFQVEMETSDGTYRVVAGDVVPKYSDDPAHSDVIAGVGFVPERRLRYGTKYRAVIDGIRGFGEDQVVKGDEIGFTIFQPTVLGSVGVEYPSDIDVLNDDRIAVANGRNGDNASSTRGLVLIDVGDPEQPVKLTEKLLSGSTLGVCAADSGIVPWFEEPVVLAVSGGLNHISSFRVMKVIGENQDGFEEAGSVLLSMDQTSLGNGLCLPNVPCMAGIPRSVALYGGDNAYVATAGIGVQGVSVKEDAIARFEEGIPGNYRNLDSQHTCGSRRSPSAVEAMGDTILSGDSNRLWLFDPDLSDGTAKYLDIPAKAVHGIPDFLSDSDGDGENEKADLVFVAGNDKTFYIVEAGSEPKVISEIGIGEYLRSVRVSPYDRVAYVGTSSGGVLIADIDDPYEGRELIDNDEDGQDDRILGKVAGTVNAEAIALGNNFGYAGDTRNGEVRTFQIRAGEYETNDCFVKGIYVRDGHLNKVPVIPGESVPLLGETIPEDRSLIWSVTKADKGVKVGIDSSSGILRPEKGTASGWVKVRAADSEIAGCYKEVWVPVGCGCGCARGECKPGEGDADLSSINLRIGMGKAEGGQSAGDIFLRADAVTSDLTGPSALEFSSLVRSTEAIYDDENAIRQILASGAFADIVASDGDGGNCEIRFYLPNAAGDKNAEGFYEPSGSPFTVWKIENPETSVLRVTENRDGNVRVHEYRWDQTLKTWSLNKGAGLRITTRSEEQDASGNRIVTETVEDDAGNIASKTRTVWKTFAWGEEIIRETSDPEGASLTSEMTYYEDSGSPGYGKIASRTDPDGSWERYEYDAEGRVIVEVRPWLGTLAGTPAGSARAICYDYAPVDPGDAGLPEDTHRARMVTEKILGQIVGKTYHAYLVDEESGERTEITERCARQDAAYGDANNERTERVYYPSSTGNAESGRIKSVLYPDGRLDSHTYEYGTYAADTFSPGSGSDVRETITHGTEDHPSGIAYKTMREITVSDEFGNVLKQETYMFTGGGYEKISWVSYTLDDFGRVTRTERSDGTVTESTWDCCGKSSDTDARGILTSYFYDDLDRTDYVLRPGFSGNVRTDYGYDAAGRRLSETVTAGDMTRSSSSVYDIAGRMKSTSDPAGLVTTYGYEDGGRKVTVTRPGNITEITERHLDGQAGNVYGSGVITRHHEYGVNTDGTRWTKVYSGSTDNSSPSWEKSTTDMLGRIVRTERPGFDMGAPVIEVTENIYESGRLVRTSGPGQADTLYEYDELGRQFRTGLDIDGNGALDDASSDRISESESFYAYIDEAWWQTTERRVYAKENDGTLTLTGTVRTRLTGLGTASEKGLMTQETVSEDIYGNETVSRTFLNRANQTETRVTDHPDSLFHSESVSVKGFLVSSTSRSGVEITYGYDALGRRTGLTDPRTGTTVTHYDEKGRIDYVKDAADNHTHFYYDENTGRKTAEKNALGKMTRYAYNDRGQVTHTWGDVPYPVRYVYDETYGPLKEMHTYRGGSGWDGGTWPGDTGTGDVTRWHYDNATGLLTSKEYADGKKTVYSYTKGGKLRTRKWARNDGTVVTTYSYDPDTGEQTSVDYSDDTADITFAYDRLGRTKNVIDAVGTRTFVYDGNTLQLTSESITGLYERTITRTYETAGVRGRSTGFYLGIGEYGVTYGYDSDTGRFGSVAWNIGGASGTAACSYVENSDLLHKLTSADGNLKTTYTYEDKRNLRTQVKNEYGTNLISQYDYEYDEIGRRRSVKNTGSAFTAAAFNLYNYNDRSELTGSHRYEGTDTGNPGGPLGSEPRVYAYDSIGNRESATEGTTDISYVSNDLNQYTALTGGVTANPTYDDDGNMLSDAERNYAWNAENRLVLAEPRNPTDEDRKAEFLYDYMGRRVRKTVFAYAAGTWTQESEKLFVYDGWNLIEEITEQGGAESSKYYVWGLDLSQSLQGAGGVGGLICSVDNAGNTLYYLYDANGNVGQLVADDGSIAAHYEYDPFGNEIVADGVMAEENPFRFSTKYYDAETGLLYYGFRYYSPELGRWVTREPIGEGNEINLFCFVSNDSIDLLDYLGFNEVIISGGINTDLERDTHDRNWKHFVLAAELEIQKRRRTLAKGEIIEWYVQETSYRDRYINDDNYSGIYKEGYLNEIKDMARRYRGDVILIWYKDKEELAHKVNSNMDSQPRTALELIRRFTFYGHGVPGKLWLEFRGRNAITNQDISAGLLLKSAFAENCKAISWACNTSSSVRTADGSLTSFAGSWHSYFGFGMQGVIGQTSYYPTHESHWWKFWHKPQPPIPGNNGQNPVIIPGPGE